MIFFHQGIFSLRLFLCVCKLPLQKDGHDDTCEQENAPTDEDFTASMFHFLSC